METRILKLHLSEHLKKRNLSPTKLAAEIGIAPPTLNKMLNDRWEYVARDAIERTADYLGLQASEIFELVPVSFWKSIEISQQCTFLRGSQDLNAVENELTIPGPDIDATNVIVPFVRRFVPNVRFIDDERDVERLIERSQRENCIAVGSPKSNAATEILLSHFFGAKPFNADQGNRLKIPFGFCWPEVSRLEKESALTCSGRARKKTGLRAGIAIQGGPSVEADYVEPSDFLQWAPDKLARDPGLVFVANKPFGTSSEVKLIVVAGFSGIGTFGAAKALIEDFRYLEPTQKENFVFGVVQCWYTKHANDVTRKYQRFRWKFRTGMLPIDEKDEKTGKASKEKAMTSKRAGE